MSLRLVPLRIPSGWKVVLNDFTESSPEKFIDDDYEHRWEFKEDILRLENDYKQQLIDLGWYPEFQADGMKSLGSRQSTATNDGHTRLYIEENN
ncbi:hypothetical protein D3C73_890610 [compost metagenome]